MFASSALTLYIHPIAIPVHARVAPVQGKPQRWVAGSVPPGKMGKGKCGASKRPSCSSRAPAAAIVGNEAAEAAAAAVDAAAVEAAAARASVQPLVPAGPGDAIVAKKNSDKLPRAIQLIMEIMGKQAQDVTVRDIAGLDGTARKNAMTAMVSAYKTRNPEMLAKYKKCSSDTDRRQWLCTFLIDPACGECSGVNTTAIKNKRSDEDSENWVTLNQLASPTYLCSMDDAKLAITTCDSRPHENAALAAQGIKQYFWVTNRTKRAREQSDTNKVAIKSDIDGEDFEQIRTAMQGALGDTKIALPPAPKEKRKKPTTTPSPEKDADRDARDTLDKVLRSMHALVDKVNFQIREMQKIEEELKKKQGFGGLIAPFVNDQSKIIQTSSDGVMAFWTTCSTKRSGNPPPTIAQLASMTEECESHTKKLQIDFEAYNSMLKNFSSLAKGPDTLLNVGQ